MALNLWKEPAPKNKGNVKFTETNLCNNRAPESYIWPPLDLERKIDVKISNMLEADTEPRHTNTINDSAQSIFADNCLYSELQDPKYLD